MKLETFDIDPLYMCHCGRAPTTLVGVVGGRYVEAEAAYAAIEAIRAEGWARAERLTSDLTESHAQERRLECKIRLAQAVLQDFKDGCQRLLDKCQLPEVGT